MKLCQALQDLVMLVLNDENTNYEVNLRETNHGHNDIEDIIDYRYLFIDNSPSFIRGTQFKMKRGLDSVDVLEQLRRDHALPGRCYNVADLDSAYARSGLKRGEVDFIEEFFAANSKKDYQLLAIHEESSAGIAMIIKENQDIHFYIKFTVRK